MSLKNLSEPHYNGSLFAHDNFIVCKCRIFWLTTADLQGTADICCVQICISHKKVVNLHIIAFRATEKGAEVEFGQ